MRWTLPNILTVSRFGLAALLLVFLTLSFPFRHSLALIVFVAAGLTDFVDGYLARHVYGVTSFGQLLDPLADKVMVCAAFVAFVGLQVLPAWIVVIIISREFLVTGLRLLAMERGQVLSVGKWGKHKTAWQIVAIVALLLGLAVRHDLLRNADPRLLTRYDFCFGYIAFAVGLAVAMITVASGVIYFTEHKDLLGRHAGRPGG